MKRPQQAELLGQALDALEKVTRNIDFFGGDLVNLDDAGATLRHRYQLLNRQLTGTPQRRDPRRDRRDTNGPDRRRIDFFGGVGLVSLDDAGATLRHRFQLLNRQLADLPQRRDPRRDRRDADGPDRRR